MSNIKLRFVITVVVAVMVFFALVGVFAYLVWFEIFPQTDAFFIAEYDLEAANKHIDDFNIILAPSLAKYSDQIEDLEKNFFSSDRERDGRDFLSLLQRTAKNNDLQLNTAEIPSGLTSRASFRISGGLPNMFKFLRELENERFFLTLESIAIQKGSMSIQLTLEKK